MAGLVPPLGGARGRAVPGHRGLPPEADGRKQERRKPGPAGPGERGPRARRRTGTSPGRRTRHATGEDTPGPRRGAFGRPPRYRLREMRARGEHGARRGPGVALPPPLPPPPRAGHHHRRRGANDEGTRDGGNRGSTRRADRRGANAPAASRGPPERAERPQRGQRAAGRAHSRSGAGREHETRRTNQRKGTSGGRKLGERPAGREPRERR